MSVVVGERRGIIVCNIIQVHVHTPRAAMQRAVRLADDGWRRAE
jgi:hypothetical protein